MQAIRPKSVRSGSVAIEYVCIIAVITVAVGFSLARMGSSMKQSLDRISSEDSASGQVVEAAAKSPTATPIAQSQPVVRTTPYSLIFFLFALIVAGAGTAYAMRKHWVADEEIAPGDAAVTRSVAQVSRGLFNKRQQILTSISTHWHSAISNELLVSDLMTTGPKSVTRDCSKAELVELMDDMNLHHTLVVEDDQLLGIISDRDLKNREGETAGDLMTAAPRTVSPSAKVSEAIEIILRQRFSCLPVLRGDEICGILTTSDLAMGFQCTLRVLDQIAMAISGEIELEDAEETPAGPSDEVKELLMAHLKN